MSTTVVREGLILFSGPMVRAIRDGTKTKTRRAVKLRGLDIGEFPREGCGLDAIGMNADGMLELQIQTEVDDCSVLLFRCPYGKPGDRLRVRETFGVCWGDGALIDPTINYRADGAQVPIRPGTEMFDQWREWYRRPRKRAWNPEHWRPGRFMPRFLSRTVLEVTSVGIERLQDITEEEVLAEGFVSEPDDIGPRFGLPGCMTNRTGYAAFAKLWDKLNDKRGFGWDRNPWVWVVEFKRVSGGN